MVRLPSEVTLSSQKLLLEKPTWSTTPFLFVAPIHRMLPSSDWLILAAFVPSDMDQRDTESYAAMMSRSTSLWASRQMDALGTM